MRLPFASHPKKLPGTVHDKLYQYLLDFFNSDEGERLVRDADHRKHYVDLARAIVDGLKVED
jgi:hypothetical protein